MKHHTNKMRSHMPYKYTYTVVYRVRLVRSAKTVTSDEYTQQKHCQGLLAAVKKFQLKFNCNGNNSTHEAHSPLPLSPPHPPFHRHSQTHSKIHDMRDNQMNLSSGEALKFRYSTLFFSFFFITSHFLYYIYCVFVRRTH